MHALIAALRQLKGPLVALAIATLLLQTLLAGVTEAQTAARIAIFGADVLCHGAPDPQSDQGSAPSGSAHACCVFCTGGAPAALATSAPPVARLTPIKRISAAADPRDVRLPRRAIRAGPSQAPPIA